MGIGNWDREWGLEMNSEFFASPASYHADRPKDRSICFARFYITAILFFYLLAG